jgi:hypothetical protein
MKDVPLPRPRGKAVPMSRAAAESLAIEGLTFLAEDPARIERFLSLAGLDPASLREAAQSPGFLAAVLDHFAGEEDLLLAFATNRGFDPSTIAKAREILAPPDEA